MKKLFVLSILLNLSFQALNQDFVGEASLPAVDEDGFYKIVISPQVSPFFNSQFSNVRIFNNQNKETPYLFQKEAPELHSEKFREYEIVEKKQIKNCCTQLTLHNPDASPINNISLAIKNAEVTKQASLLGSDDRKNWYALKQHFVLNSIANRNQTSEIKIVDFPLSNYAFYLLEIEDSLSAPINILTAGYYEINSEAGDYSAIPAPRIMAYDSSELKRTFVKIIFDTARLVDRLTISMTGQPYFLRKATLCTKRKREVKKGKMESFYDPIYFFELSSKQPSEINLYEEKVTELLMIIENNDNPALEIDTIKAFQLNRFFTAWLKKGERYTIKIGNPDLKSPTYDLAFFKDKIPDEPALLSIETVTLFKGMELASADHFLDNQLLIWIAIILVIIVLGFMSVRLVKEKEFSERS